MSVIAKEKPKAKKPAKMETVAQEATVFENAIILRSTFFQPGIIETNSESILEAVREKTKQYLDVSKYTDDKQAKDDRALLRKQKDLIKTTMASIREAWNKPIEPTESFFKQIQKEYDIAIDTIDVFVKGGEAREKATKRLDIESYFDSKDFYLVPLDKIFIDQWTNKTYKMLDIKKEIDGKIAEILSNLKILESISDYGMAAKSLYLESLDMGAAMRQVETIKANAERAAREKIEREEYERRAQISANAVQERQEEKAERKNEQVKSLVDAALDIKEPETPPNPEILEYACNFRGTKDALFRLREFMTANGISYTKLMCVQNCNEVIYENV